MTRLIGGENVIKGAVLSDNHDYMLDGGSGASVLLVIVSGCGKRRAEIRDKREEAGGNGKVLPGFRQEGWYEHDFSS